MKVSDLIMKLIEGCGGNLNKELESFTMDELGFRHGKPIINVHFRFKVNKKENKLDNQVGSG